MRITRFLCYFSLKNELETLINTSITDQLQIHLILPAVFQRTY